MSGSWPGGDGISPLSAVPGALEGFFLLTVLAGLALFGWAIRWSRLALMVCLVWIALQSAVALRGFYLITKTVPPHLFAAIAPPLLLIAGVFLTAAGLRFVNRMDLKGCVLVHTIRVLVELNLFGLFLYKEVPRLMTFEGGNLDILAGLTAPLAWWAFRTGRIGRRGLMVWNGVCLLSVLNAVVRALLSAPFRFQQFGFDQPTLAILRFPFVLLPAFLVPVVLFCHFAVFRKLLNEEVQPG